MQRTNIYLDADTLRALKIVAAEERQSMATIVRRAVDAYLGARFQNRDDWDRRFGRLVESIQRRIPPDVTPEMIEADITAAREEVRRERRAARGG